MIGQNLGVNNHLMEYMLGHHIIINNGSSSNNSDKEESLANFSYHQLPTLIRGQARYKKLI